VAQQIAQAKAPAAAAVDTYQVLNGTEQAFIQAAVDTFIPADGLSPSGTECGVAVFIDRQLAGGYGNGARFYRSGPFLKGKPEHGYQLSLTPVDYFRQGIAETNAWSRKTRGKDFDRLSPADRDAALKEIDAGKAEFSGLNAKAFLEALLLLAMEGFFSDPIYGGNRDMAAWKMIGYPGLPATYADKIEQYRGKKYDGAPQSIADFS
jgi:gluconate 2-dehydrogenase gamma chain